ncbi:ECF transporter S component [Lactobacillus sp. PV037]|uniref:ECF transporter S component n=1 Tax=unclassified Lactobacillus TaxID=2620435 RepID=UPI00223FFBE1|nr:MULTISPECIES: ECF transporter S component [unclassified Lactobacillus]QNQ82678.1 ECF transporter S component [Lactobacillus sp. PV012]QNQ83204.1 ECF transporter S component [Lactobacillus sp. PV037]
MIRKKIQRLTIAAIFVAIILLQTFVPYIGYLHLIPGLPAVTTIPLTIAIAASLMGVSFGGWLGFFWGALRLILAYVQPSDVLSLLLFQNPLIAVLPRAVAGVVGGLVAKLAKGKSNPKRLIYFLVGVVTSLTNTLGVIVMTTLVYMWHPGNLLHALGQTNNSNPLLLILFTALGINGIGEMIFTGILTPIIVIPLKRSVERKLR